MDPYVKAIEQAKANVRITTIPFGIAAVAVVIRWASFSFDATAIGTANEAVSDKWLFVIVFFLINMACWLCRKILSRKKKLVKQLVKAKAMVKSGAIKEKDFRQAAILAVAEFLSEEFQNNSDGPSLETIELLSNLIQVHVESSRSELEATTRLTLKKAWNETLRKKVKNYVAEELLQQTNSEDNGSAKRPR